METERSYCPLVPIAPSPNIMTRVSEVTGYDNESQRCLPDPNDYSETQYHALPSVTPKSLCPLVSPLCRSDLTIASREGCPVVGRSSYRTGSAAIRSASLSPSRVRDLSSQYDAGKRPSSSPRNYDLYSSSKSPDRGLSPRIKSETLYSPRNEVIQSPRPSHYATNIFNDYSEVKQIPYRAFSAKHHNYPDYEHGNSDVEADQNTSGDLLNLSNLSLSDDGVLNESEAPDLPLTYSTSSHQCYTSPREVYGSKKISSASLSLPHTSVRHHTSPREVFIPKRSAIISPVTYTDPTPKSILSPRNRNTDVPSSYSVSDSVHRILLPSEDLNTRRSEPSLSPRRQKSWQTLRPSYLQPPRSTMRRSVTFTDPEFEGPYVFRDDDVSLYSGSYGSLRHHSPSLPISSWESSDHERFLREKQGREKDAFREKIERLKELIQENKDQEIGMTASAMDGLGTASSSRTKINEALVGKDSEVKEKSSFRDSLDTKDWKLSQSRRPSLAKELSSESLEQLSEGDEHIDKQAKSDEKLKSMTGSGDEDVLSETISDKEQWSGQFNEKDEDAHEKIKMFEKYKEKDLGEGVPTSVHNEVGDTKKIINDQSLDDGYGQKTEVLASQLEQKGEAPDGNQEPENDQFSQRELAQSNFENQFSSHQPDALNENNEKESDKQGKESAEFINMESQQPLQSQRADYTYEEKHLPEQTSGFDFKSNEPVQHEQDDPNYQGNQQPIGEEEKNFNEYTNDFSYEGNQPQQHWASKEENQAEASEQNVNYNYGQGEQSPIDYKGQNQSGGVQETGFEQFPTEGEQDQQNYENYPSNTEPQSQTQENYGENTAYESYQEPQPESNSGSGFQDYSEDQNQYQQNYQPYAENQQYGEQQEKNYASQEPNSYQYPEDSSKSQYEYEGQGYDYQQDQNNYNYSQDPNYEDPSYEHDQPYQQDPNYQQGQQYQEPGYQESQQYGGYQPGADDLSEDTTPSADTNYPTPYKTDESADQQQSKYFGVKISLVDIFRKPQFELYLTN